MKEAQDESEKVNEEKQKILKKLSKRKEI